MGSRRQLRPSERPASTTTAPGGQPLAVGALAIGDARANAVGPVRLTCERHMLRIDLFGVGRFSGGFAFATLADAVSFRVPYRAVRGMVRDGRSLLLSLDPQAAAPYSRFALTRFSGEPIHKLMRAFRVRALASAASFVLPLPITAAVTWALHRRDLADPVGLAAIALITCVLSFRLLRGLTRWLSWGGPLSDRLQGAFERAVSAQLGLELAPDLVASPAGRAPQGMVEPAPVRATQAMGAFLRPVAFAIVGSLAVGAAAAAVISVQRYGVAQRVVLPVADARSGFVAPAQALASAGLVDGATQHPGCSCGQVDSTLWRAGLPQISILVSPIRGAIDTIWLERDKTYAIRFADGDDPTAELDLAIVNNSTQKLRSLDFVMTFAFRDESGRRQGLRERGLHWEANLGPGETVKWRVEAPGTELKIETRHNAKLETVGVAPADAFVSLSKARLPVVRLHGAMMLAMLRDPRAAALGAAAGEVPPAGAKARAELMRTLSPLAICDIVVSEGGGFDACVQNGTGSLYRSLTIGATDGEGGTLRHVVRDFFHPREGLRVHVPLESSGRTIVVETTASP